MPASIQTPNITFKYADSSGTERTILVNRETPLINSNGQSCAMVNFDTSKNKI